MEQSLIIALWPLGWPAGLLGGASRPLGGLSGPLGEPAGLLGGLSGPLGRPSGPLGGASGRPNTRAACDTLPQNYKRPFLSF